MKLGESPFETGSLGGTDTSSRSYYWCQTSIHHEHGDGYWDRRLARRIAGTRGEVQPLSRDWRLRGVLLNWLGVSPLETEDTGGAFQPVACVVAPSVRCQEDEDYTYWHRGEVLLLPPRRQAFPGPRASCGGPDGAKAEPGCWCISATAERHGTSGSCSVNRT